jgi:very-short-patch-repair endonuclease
VPVVRQILGAARDRRMTTPAQPTSVPTPATPTASADGRVAASIDAWKRKLLDLSKRNRALNFRATKVSTVSVTDEHPAEAFRMLYLAEREMRFKAQEPPPEAAAAEATTTQMASADAPSSITDEEVDNATPRAEFVPYDAATLDDRHSDDYLQTTSSPEALDRSLRRLDEQARLAIEEQGVNTLFLALGMLSYTETETSEQVFRAPLVMLPVQLSRKSARSGYRLRAADDEPVVNPALAEYLRLDFGLTLPELPDSATIPDDYDLQTLFAAVSEAIAGRKGWSVTTDIVLALFSFQKFVMYKDLEANAASVAAHRLVRQLVGREGDRVIGLPDDIRRLELDREFAPEATTQVVDADSSQLRAIAGVARGYDLVLEGPPGTGKSQTITNLIAQALGSGKSVLFVAEKMAALDVVHSRLVKAGLGEFCLELHSTKASKRSVMRSLAAAIDASLTSTPVGLQAGAALPGVRAGLNDYVRALHTPDGTLGMTPFEAYGALAPVRGADTAATNGTAAGPPRLRYTRRVDDVTRETLDTTVREVRELAAAAHGVNDPAQHPWRGATRTLYTEDDIASARELATELARQLRDVRRQAREVSEVFGLPPMEAPADVDTADRIATIIQRSPGAPESVLASTRWNSAPSDALGMIERGKSLEALRQRIEERFTPQVFDQDHGDDIAYVEKKAEGVLSFLSALDGRWRSIRSRWERYRVPTYEASLIEQAAEMKQVERLAAERKSIRDAEPVARLLFGDLWKGDQTSWSSLEAYVQWVVEFRSCVTRYSLGSQAIGLAAQRAPNVDRVHGLRNATADALGTLASLRRVVGWPTDYLTTASFEELDQRAEALAANAGAAPRWAAFEAARQTVAAGIASELLDEAMRGNVAFDQLTDAFLRAFYMKWLAEVVQSRPPLARFDALTHEQRIAEFRRLDRQVLGENQAVLTSRLRDRAQERLQEPRAREALPFLQREMAKQRNHSPLRKTLRHAESAIRAIKPCFLMSPLSVAQYLAGGEPAFDVVIFDEASQLPSEDAVGAIVRGRQLVVVGDPKQLPPTNFFMVASSPDAVTVDDDGTPIYSDTESVLEEFMGAGVPMSRLRWHYRSAHESLISFSNVAFYDADLFTFPSTETGASANGLRFEFVADATYEGKGLNSAEARRVADEVVAFARTQLMRQARGEPTESLGVGTFNLRQQLAVQDELERRRRDDPSIEPFFDRSLPEPFFVKNLENIQGDERDTIFLSVTYAKAADGVLRYNFGALNGENGWRRLNVLTTRARRRMTVFASMHAADIAPTSAVSQGPRLLRDFLDYAEHGRLTLPNASASAAAESPFEREVMLALIERGLTVVPQVGVAGYRIDLGVVDDEVPGRFVCGIECDGVAYHASETARDRDRLRQQVLEARGWALVRVWSTDWFKDRAGQVERVVKFVEEARRQARDASARVPEPDPATPTPNAAPAVDQATIDATDYRRPVAAEYEAAKDEGRYADRELLSEPPATLATAIGSVVEIESPVHVDDVITRVAAMWDTRAGIRIHARIVDAFALAERQQLIERRGNFLWNPGTEVVVRSRAGTRIPAERIAPEEYRAAVELVLRGGRSFARPALANEVRSVLGFARTSETLDEAIGAVLDAMVADGVLGEGSTGVRLR